MEIKLFIRLARDAAGRGGEIVQLELLGRGRLYTSTMPCTGNYLSPCQVADTCLPLPAFVTLISRAVTRCAAPLRLYPCLLAPGSASQRYVVYFYSMLDPEQTPKEAPSSVSTGNYDTVFLRSLDSIPPEGMFGGDGRRGLLDPGGGSTCQPDSTCTAISGSASLLILDALFYF